jgi:hypothetical protein
LIKSNNPGRIGNPSGPLTAARLLARLAQWLADRRRALGDRMFAAHDAHARVIGWQVTPIHGGLGRHYRDPRFDGLSRWREGTGCGEGAGCGEGITRRESGVPGDG